MPSSIPKPPWPIFDKVSIPVLPLPEKVRWWHVVRSLVTVVLLVPLELMVIYMVLGTLYLMIFDRQSGYSATRGAGMVWVVCAMAFATRLFGLQLIGEFIRLSKMLNRKLI